MKAPLSIIFILSTVFCFGQSDSTSSKREIRVMIISSPDYTYRLSTPKVPNESDKPALRYRLGVDIEYELRKKLFLKSGVRYVCSGYLYVPPDWSKLTFGDFIDIRTNLVYDPWNEEIATFNQNDFYYHEIEIPLAIKYYPLKTGFNINAGISCQYLFNTTETIPLKSGQTTTLANHNFTKYILSTNLGIGYDFLISSEFILSLNPVFRLNLTNSCVGSYFDEKIYSAGLEFGIGKMF